MVLRFEKLLTRRTSSRSAFGLPYRVARRGHGRRQGFSLMELLLVLVILAIMAAMIMPQLYDVETRQALRSAADQLNGSMVDARQQAMVSGQTMFMLFQFEAGLYALVPEPIDDETTAQFDQATDVLNQAVERARMMGNDNSINSSVLPGIEQLPSGARFLSGVAGTEQSTDNAAVQADLTGLPYVAFFPDGTTDDALIQLVSEEQDRITLQLRGLTGAVRVGELIGPDQLGTGAVQ